jgi:hypothetical protein
VEASAVARQEVLSVPASVRASALDSDFAEHEEVSPAPVVDEDEEEELELDEALFPPLVLVVVSTLASAVAEQLEPGAGACATAPAAGTDSPPMTATTAATVLVLVSMWVTFLEDPSGGAGGLGARRRVPEWG